jgi:hypothetical protein
MSPKGQHPATPGSSRVTARHPARSIYQNPAGSHLRQVAERLELCGLAPEVDDRAEGFEQDLQDDLTRERERKLPWFPKSLRLRRIDTTDNEKRAA